MTDDLANVLTDWAEFNDMNIKAIHSTSNYHVVSVDSDLNDFPHDLLDAISEDFSIVFHPELTSNFFKLIPKNDFSKNDTLGDNYKKWRKYAESPMHTTWDGEP
jgi:hypothetical protein